MEGNLALWLDASNINGLNNSGLANGDAIAEWRDLSGNGHDLGVLNAANSPNYNAQRGAIEFDGVDDYLFATTSEAMTDFTMIAVTKIGALDFDAATHRGGGVVAVVDGNHFDAIAYDEHPNSQRRFMNGSTNFNRTPEMISSVEETSLANKLIINQIENNNFKMVRDGVTVASHAYASALRQNIRYAVGQRFMSTTNEGTPDGFWLGDIMEVMIISRSLSNEEQIAINHYLAKKWNLTATVDSDGDGFTDADEMSLGTNPVDASSNPMPDFSDTVDSELFGADITINTNGNAYELSSATAGIVGDGLNPTLTLTPGARYNFTHNGSGHPFKITIGDINTTIQPENRPVFKFLALKPAMAAMCAPFIRR